MKVYKHHLSKNILSGQTPIDGGIGRNATVFTDYDYMIIYLKKDGRKWHYCEAEIDINDLRFNFKNNYKATIMRSCIAENYSEIIINYLTRKQ